MWSMLRPEPLTTLGGWNMKTLETFVGWEKTGCHFIRKKRTPSTMEVELGPMWLVFSVCYSMFFPRCFVNARKNMLIQPCFDKDMIFFKLPNLGQISPPPLGTFQKNPWNPSDSLEGFRMVSSVIFAEGKLHLFGFGFDLDHDCCLQTTTQTPIAHHLGEVHTIWGYYFQAAYRG